VEFYFPEGHQRNADQAYVVSGMWNSKEWGRSVRLSVSVCPLYFLFSLICRMSFLRESGWGSRLRGASSEDLPEDTYLSVFHYACPLGFGTLAGWFDG
jgi:hypothetical protein